MGGRARTRTAEGGCFRACVARQGAAQVDAEKNMEIKGRGGAHFVSFANHTVEKWPQPSLRTMRYLPSEKVSPMCTGWYPPLT